jgi:diguanylate cyclase (GGDEF)-like protein
MNCCDEIQYYQYALGLILIFGAFIYFRQYLKIKQLLESEDSLITEVYFDELTDLPNRRNIETVLTDQISRCARHEKSFFVAYIKIDNLNDIFQNSSKEQGDMMTQKAADTLFNCIRKEDMVGHISRDAFIIIFNEYLQEDKLEIIFKRVFDSMGKDFDYSVGISLFPDDAQETQHLIESAENAAKKVSEKESKHFHLFQSDS